MTGTWSELSSLKKTLKCKVKGRNRQPVSRTRGKEHQVHDQAKQPHPGVVSGAVTMCPHCPRGQGVRVTPTLTRTICQVCCLVDTWSIDDRLPNLCVTKSTVRVFYTVFTPTEKAKYPQSEIITGKCPDYVNIYISLTFFHWGLGSINLQQVSPLK